MMNFIAQFGIFVLGPAAIWLTSGSPRMRKVAPWVGLSSQPLWFWASTHPFQWGLFLVTFVYTAAWVRGAIGSLRA